MEIIVEKQLVWTYWQMITFRFFAIFFILFIAVNPNILLAMSGPFYRLYMPILESMATWTSRHVFALEQLPVFTPTGSGDTLAHYIFMFMILVTSIAGTMFWSVIGRNHKNYNKQLYWLCVIVRYYLGLTMVVYGFSKVFKVQFPDPSALTLNSTFGNSSSMGLAWTFFGYSKGYNYLMGFAEICSLLLLFRRTMVLGAVITLFVTINVMAINYCFNIPVKILSTMLVAMSIFLLAPYGKRLLNFFILNKAVPPLNLMPYRFKEKWLRISSSVLKYGLIIFVLGVGINMCLYSRSLQKNQAKQNLALGNYTIKQFSTSNASIQKWDRLTLNTDSIKIESVGNQPRSFHYTLNSADKKIEWTGSDGLTCSLYYSKLESGELTLKGNFNKSSLSIKLLMDAQPDSRLMTDAFHWITD